MMEMSTCSLGKLVSKPDPASATVTVTTGELLSVTVLSAGETLTMAGFSPSMVAVSLSTTVIWSSS